ncbi:MAG: hypothetical protein D6767_01390 [Candidatus Hydrogenedentota bacterium]|nr:MAG: hypothetical protein D6767_01390 [Candidatus Hydrogenedentota bacterium]
MGVGTAMAKRIITFSVFLFISFCGSAEKKTEEPADTLTQTLHAIDGEEVIPQKYKVIYVHLFRNRSFKSDFVSRLKEKIEDEFRKDGRLVVAEDKHKADLWMYGTIESYIRVPTDYDEFGKPTRMRLALVVSFRLHDPNNSDDPVVLDTRIVRFDTGWNQRVPPFESEFTAEERLLQGLARRIVYTSFEGWYTELKNEVELGYEKDDRKEITDPRTVGRGLSRKEREKLLKEKYKIKGEKKKVNPDDPYFK